MAIMSEAKQAAILYWLLEAAMQFDIKGLQDVAVERLVHRPGATSSITLRSRFAELREYYQGGMQATVEDVDRMLELIDALIIHDNVTNSDIRSVWFYARASTIVAAAVEAYEENRMLYERLCRRLSLFPTTTKDATCEERKKAYLRGLNEELEMYDGTDSSLESCPKMRQCHKTKAWPVILTILDKTELQNGIGDCFLASVVRNMVDGDDDVQLTIEQEQQGVKLLSEQFGSLIAAHGSPPKSASPPPKAAAKQSPTRGDGSGKREMVQSPVCRSSSPASRSLSPAPFAQAASSAGPSSSRKNMARRTGKLELPAANIGCSGKREEQVPKATARKSAPQSPPPSASPPRRRSRSLSQSPARRSSALVRPRIPMKPLDKSQIAGSSGDRIRSSGTSSNQRCAKRPQVADESVDESSESESRHRRKKRHFEVQRSSESLKQAMGLTTRCKAALDEGVYEEWSDDELEIIKSIPEGRMRASPPKASGKAVVRRRSSSYTPVKLRDVLSASQNSGRRRQTVRWSDDEVEQLRRGVKRYGVGCWAMILSSGDFASHRTAPDLKDKYRNLVKSAARS